MKFNIGGEASFFKILLNTENHLRLPADFANKYLEKHNINQQKLVLQNISGDKWSVKYLKIGDRYYFMDGWLDFMNDNGLQNRDFHVFWLLSSSPKPTFQVFPYAPNGCLKYPCSSDDAAGGDHGRGRRKPPVKEESSDINDSSENMQQSTISVVVKKSYTNRMPLRKSFLKANGADGYGSVRLKNDEGKTWDLAITNNGPQPASAMMIRGWSEFRKYNKINIGNTCEFRHLKSNLFHVRVIKKKKRGFKIS